MRMHFVKLWRLAICGHAHIVNERSHIRIHFRQWIIWRGCTWLPKHDPRLVFVPEPLEYRKELNFCEGSALCAPRDNAITGCHVPGAESIASQPSRRHMHLQS